MGSNTPKTLSTMSFGVVHELLVDIHGGLSVSRSSTKEDIAVVIRFVVVASEVYVAIPIEVPLVVDASLAAMENPLTIEIPLAHDAHLAIDWIMCESPANFLSCISRQGLFCGTPSQNTIAIEQDAEHRGGGGGGGAILETNTKTGSLLSTIRSLPTTSLRRLPRAAVELDVIELNVIELDVRECFVTTITPSRISTMAGLTNTATTINTDYSKTKFSMKPKPQPADWEATDKSPLWCEYHGPSSHVAADCKRAAVKRANIKAEEKKQLNARKIRETVQESMERLFATADRIRKVKAFEKAAKKAAKKTMKKAAKEVEKTAKSSK
ncbi:hypothetical protein Q7P37_006280 [Cladosporium fusiforme]